MHKSVLSTGTAAAVAVGSKTLNKIESGRVHVTRHSTDTVQQQHQHQHQQRQRQRQYSVSHPILASTYLLPSTRLPAFQYGCLHLHPHFISGLSCHFIPSCIPSHGRAPPVARSRPGIGSVVFAMANPSTTGRTTRTRPRPALQAVWSHLPHWTQLRGHQRPFRGAACMAGTWIFLSVEMVRDVPLRPAGRDRLVPA